ERFPQFDADIGRLDVEAGFLYVPAITQALLASLRERQVNILEEVDVMRIEQRDARLHIVTNAGEFSSEKLVVTAGLGAKGVLERITGCGVRFPLLADRPRQCQYFIPPAGERRIVTSDTLPVFA